MFAYLLPPLLRLGLPAPSVHTVKLYHQRFAVIKPYPHPPRPPWQQLCHRAAHPVAPAPCLERALHPPARHGSAASAGRIVVITRGRRYRRYWGHRC